MLRVTEVTAPDVFQSLRDRWNRCLSRSGQDTIFLTWEWLFTWWEMYGSDGRLFILLAQDETGEVAGIAPFYTASESILGLRLRTLRFLGSNEACSEYLDVFVRKDRIRDVLDAFSSHLKSQMSRWDLFHFLDVPEHALVDHLFARFRDHSPRFKREWRQTTNLFIILPGTEAAYNEAPDRHKRRDVVRRVRKLAREQGVSYWVTQECGPSVDEAFDTLVKLHQALWNSRGLPGMFKRRDFLRFHRAVAQRSAENGWLRLCFLSSNGTDLAALYGFQYGGKFYYYQSGFRPEWKPLGVGKALVYHTILDAIRNRLTEYDFLRGTDDYKFEFTTTFRQTREILLAKDRWVLSLYLLRKELKRRAKDLLKPALPQELSTWLKQMRDHLVLR